MFANGIKQMRELKNLTQEFMARKLNMSQSGYSKIESGQSGVSLAKLHLIAEILDLNPEELISTDNAKTTFEVINSDHLNKNAEARDVTSSELRVLYESKIALLEKLLHLAESELERLKTKYGEL